MTKNKIDVMRLKENEAVFMKESNIKERRLYRYNKQLMCLEYSDNKITWNVSNLSVDCLNSLDLLIEEL